MMKDDKRLITPNEAIGLLNEGDDIHTFRNPSGIMLGCDWSRESIIKSLKKNHDKIELGGEGCRSMKHGLIVWDDGSPLFIETDEEKLNVFDPQ